MHEFIVLVLRKQAFSVIEKEHFGLVFAKTGSINSGTGVFHESVSPGYLSIPMGQLQIFTKIRHSTLGPGGN